MFCLLSSINDHDLEVHSEVALDFLLVSKLQHTRKECVIMFSAETIYKIWRENGGLVLDFARSLMVRFSPEKISK